MMSNSIPTLILSEPHAGWWPIDVKWQGERYLAAASCVCRDSFVEMIVWFESILLDHLPAVWCNNEEELQWPLLAEKAGAGQIHLTVHPKYLGAGFRYDWAVKDSYPVLAQGTFEARAFVQSWYQVLRTEWDSERFKLEDWDSDLRILDCSRLEALLAGTPAPASWLADYADDKARSDRYDFLMTGLR